LPPAEPCRHRTRAGRPMTPGTRLAVALGTGLLAGLALWSVGVALRPRRVPARPRARLDSTLLVLAVMAGLLVLVVTRWPIAALAAVALVMAWPQLFAGGKADRERRRLDAIAKWLEDLRDLQAGSN